MRIRRGILFLLAMAALAPAQIRDNAGFKSKTVPRNDDGSSGVELLGWTANFFGRFRSSLYVNNNGNVTFDTALPTYTPFGLTGVNREIIAAFFADVDTRNEASELVTYGSDMIGDRRAFGVNYFNVGYYNQHVDRTNTFQLVLIQRADTGEGNFDIEFNYSRIQWETGDASNGVGGLGGVSASVGWSNGSGLPGTSFELPGSLIPGSFLDNGGYSLTRGRTVGSSTSTGRWVFRARGGTIIPPLTMTTGCPLPNASLGRSYSQRFEAAGSKAPYRWSIVADPDTTLSGVTMSTAGLLSGSFTQPGEYNFTVRVAATDEDGEVVVGKRCSITVDPPVLSFLTGTALPNTATGARYTTTLRAEGGTGPFQYSLFNSAPIPGLTLSSNGTLAGTPTVPGIYQIQVQARSETRDQSVPAMKRFRLNVSPSELSIRGTCPLPNATGDVPYQYQFEAAGGIAPYRWSTIGTLPNGVYMNQEGRLSGLPTVPHWWPFDVQVEDSQGKTQRMGCGLVVLFPEIKVSSSCPLPAGTAGVNYSQRLQATGGTAPYTWSTVGTLPVGLRMSPEGVLGGMPLSIGPAQFRLRVADSRGQAASVACSLAVNRGAYAIASCPLPNAYAGESYSQIISAAGGTEPYTFGEAAPLPAGLHISPSGYLAGVLPNPGTYPIALRVADRDGLVTTNSCSLTVLPPVLRLTTACPLPQGTMGQAYSAAITAAGGVTPYTFAAAPGSLPPGLQLSERGIISGTPTQPGFFPVDVGLRDTQGARTSTSCGILVDVPEPPSVRITGMPATLNPASAGPLLTVELSRAYPLPVEAELTLTVTPETTSAVGAVNRPDPAVRFSTGQRAIPLLFAPNARTATAQISSTGTVASTIEARITKFKVNGEDSGRGASAVGRIRAAAPVITNVCYAPTSEGFDVDISGYSTTRDLTTAEIVFGANTYQVDASGVATEYFSSDESVRTGGTFRVRAPYRLTQGTAQSLGQGNVVIRNSAGSSPSRSIARCN
jgi:hypothetical protein